MLFLILSNRLHYWYTEYTECTFSLLFFASSIIYLAMPVNQYKPLKSFVQIFSCALFPPFHFSNIQSGDWLQVYQQFRIETIDDNSTLVVLQFQQNSTKKGTCIFVLFHRPLSLNYTSCIASWMVLKAT